MKKRVRPARGLLPTCWTVNSTYLWPRAIACTILQSTSRRSETLNVWKELPMEPTRPKLPSEAIELYNQFIHGAISRRAFMDGVQRFAIGGLAAAAIVEALMPNYALGQQVSKTDDRIKATYETVPSPQGNGSIKGYFVRPARVRIRARSEAIEIAWHYRRPRKIGAESAHRGHCAAIRDG